MNWEAIGAMGELGGAVAVVVTLVYLAIQIRQNTASVKSNTFQSVSDSFNTWALQIIGDPEVAKLYDCGLTDYDSLERIDRVRFFLLMSAQFRNYENIYYQHRQATLDREVWPARRDAMVEFLVHPGVQRWWRRRGGFFGESFRAFVDAELAKVASGAHDSSDVNGPADPLQKST